MGALTSYTKSAYIKIENGVNADFSYETQNGCRAPAIVTFSNKSVGTGVINYTWDFGDGKTSVEKNPTHNYDFRWSLHCQAYCLQ